MNRISFIVAVLFFSTGCASNKMVEKWEDPFDSCAEPVLRSQSSEISGKEIHAWIEIQEILDSIVLTNVIFNKTSSAEVVEVLNSKLREASDGQCACFAIDPGLADIPFSLEAELLTGLQLYKILTSVTGTKISDSSKWAVIVFPDGSNSGATGARSRQTTNSNE